MYARVDTTGDVVDAVGERAAASLALEPGASFEEFRARVLAMASERDARIWPVAGSMLFGGLSVGAIMPISASQLTGIYD